MAAKLQRMSVLARAFAAPSHAQLAALLDCADEGLALLDSRRRLTYCNHAAARLLGCESGHSAELALARLSPASRGQVLAALAEPGASGWHGLGQLTEGGAVNLSVSAGPGGMRLLRAVAAEPATSAPTTPAWPPLGADATSEVVRWLWDAPQPLLVQDERFIVVAANRACLQVLGLPQAQVLGRDVIDLSPPEDRAAELEQRLVDQSEAKVRAPVGAPPGAPSGATRERRLRDRLGRDRWYRSAPRWITADDGSRLMLSILFDVTAEYERRAQVDRSLHELDHWFDLSPVGMLVYDETGLVLRSNAVFESLVGRTPVMLSEAAPDLRRLLAWDGAALHAELRPDARPLEVRGTAQAPDGRSLHLRARLRAFRSDDGPLRVMAIVEDRSLEDERDLAELEIGALMNTSGVGVATFEANRGWLPSRGSGMPVSPSDGADAAPLNVGLQSVRRDQVVPASLPEFERLQQALQQAERVQVRYEVELPGSGRRWLLTRVEPGELAGGRVTLSVVTLDITEQEALARDRELQAERTRAILDSVLVGIVTVGDGGIEWMNRSARRMFSGELADFVGSPMAVVATDEPDHPLRATHYLEALADGQAETFECRLRARDGRAFWVVGNAVVTGRQAHGSQITFALLDIERRRQAEISIAQAQASLQRIIETAPLAIALFDASSLRVLRLNSMAAQFFGKHAAEMLGRTPDECLAPDEAQALRDDLAQALDGTDVLRREQHRRDLGAGAGPGAVDGLSSAAAERVWDTRIVTIGAAADAQLLLVASDVTEQRVAENERYESAVLQREMLVKEVHHRIKNNLQGVAGLLQQTAVRRPEVAGLINEVVGQVQAIAQVHGLQVGVSGPLRLRPLLEAVTASVQRTFGRPITLELRGAAAHRFALPEAESIPTALTINELLTNAVKHGTPGPVVCMLGCDDELVTIRIHNPGRLAEGFKLQQIAPGVSGLGLVRALLPRRTATLTLEQDGADVCAQVLLRPPGFCVLEPL